MRIATFNVNGIERRLPALLDWLSETRPDAVCLQEIKTAQDRFPVHPLAEAGYGAIWCGQGAHHGVALLARGAEPVPTRTALPGDPGDREARYIEAAVGGVLIGCLYLPNGNPQPGPKFSYKLAFFERLIAHAAILARSGAPVILAGDFNVVPTDRDIYDPTSWRRNALLHPEARAAFSRLLRQGWGDAVGDLHPDEPGFTFWSDLRNGWPRDAGMRIDHLLVAPALLDRLLDAGVDRAVRGRPGASDHAPAWIDLAPVRTVAGTLRSATRRSR